MLKVIIADDEKKVCNLIYALIDWDLLNLEIVGIAHNGNDALELIKLHQPDIIITDIRMPGIDGLELIKSAKEISSGLDFIIISGYKQFAYAQNAIKYGVRDYLLKPIKKEELNDVLKKICLEKINLSQKEIQNQGKLNKLRAGLFMENLLADMGKVTYKIKNINNDYNYKFQEGFFQAFIIKIDCFGVELFKNTIKIAEDKAVNIVTSILENECYDLELFLKDSYIYGLINYPFDKKDVIRKKFRKVMDNINVKKYMFDKMDFTLAIGEASEELDSDLFGRLNYTVMQRLLLGTGKIIEQKPEQQISVKQSFILQFDEYMEKSIELLEISDLLKGFNNFKDGILKSDASGKEIYSLVLDAHELYISKLKKYQFDSDIKEDILFKYSICESAEILFDTFWLFLKDKMENIISTKKEENIKPIRIAKQYINENYMKTITLEDISGLVNFNPTYFSALFKKETNENFTVYVSKVRIKKAKELLKETNLNVSSICEMVGYSDIKHFNQNFKKYAGIKPNEYRKLYS